MMALSGVRVLDLSHQLAGPFCTMFLGDLGADVIKVEKPGAGDDTRRYAPPTWNGESCYYLALNRNKRSITLDLTSEEGSEIALTLAKTADVIVENFRPGVIRKLGLDYQSVVPINPCVIYCSISAFGQTGPSAGKPGYDNLMQAYGGLMSLTGYPSWPPVRTGISLVDFGAGMFAAIGILVALLERYRTGLGRKIETSLLETQVAWLSYYAVGWLATGKIPEKAGSGSQFGAPYQAFRARDDYVLVAVLNDRFWVLLCEAIGRKELASDPRFLTNPLRAENRAQLEEILAPIFATRTVDEWVRTLDSAGVPCTRVNTIDRVLTDPQVEHLRMLQPIPHPRIPDLKVPRLPINFNPSLDVNLKPPPMLGQHTEEVLRELGYTGRDIVGLRTRGVI